MIETKGYRCTHCDAAGRVRRTYASASSCAKHERACYMNPDNHACATCALWAFWEHEGGHGHACFEGHDCNDPNDGPKPVMHCHHWDPRPGTSIFEDM